MKHRPLTTFLVLAFALPWFVWATVIARQRGWIGWHVPAPLAFWIGLPVATFGTAALTGGWPSVRDLLRRMIRVRVAAWWYAAALLVTPALAGITVLLSLGAHHQIVTTPSTWLTVVGLFGFNAWMWLITEEPAWRGFALPRLLPRLGPLRATLAVGVVWALWHAPLFFVHGSFQSEVSPLAFAVSTLATSVVIGWIFIGAHGSVLVAALFHAATDVTIALSGVMTSGAGPLWVFVALQAVAAVGAGWRMLRTPALLRATA